MSEPVLNAIIRLFALVAKEDLVTKSERDHIQSFLSDHLSLKAVEGKMKLFDQYSHLLSGKMSSGEEEKAITSMCESINKEIAQKQKMVIMVELMSVVMVDGTISPREKYLAKATGAALNIGQPDIELIEKFLMAQAPDKLDHEDILVIDSHEQGYNQCKHIYRPGLDGFVAVLHIKSTDTYFFEYLGNSDVFLNGVPQKAGRINVLATGSAIRWKNITPIYYGDVLAQFNQMHDGARLSFEAKNITYRFKNGKLGLRQVNVFEESGKLVALMGASGAGKSTLLHVLNGTEKPTEGQVLINGIDIHQHPDKIEGVIGFVPQDDLLIEDLTVFQNLYFAAKLCFNHLSEEGIHDLVTRTLEDLGLVETKDLTVGSPLRKTISGGQRKRLNIGLELLREPTVLFCDEPTSGLSSRDSENIIDLLKELSLKGKLVFAVIHQPSSDIFKMFDKLVILDTGGYQIYYGNPIDAVTYFKQSINLINSDQGECVSCGNVNPEQIFNIIETRVINEYGNFTSERRFSPEQWEERFRKDVEIEKVLPSKEVPQSSLNIPGWLKQTKLFSLRDMLSKLGNRQYMVINLLEAPLLAFILAFIVRYYNTDNPFQDYVFAKNLNMPAYFFMSVIVALFMGLTVSAEEIIRDRKILKREAFLHLSRSSYIVSKISILFMISAFQTFLFVLVGNYILEIRGMLLVHWAILFTTSCFANLLGLNISSAFNSAITIYILIPILLIPQLILSGVVVKFDKLNPVIGNTETVPVVGDLMASRWAFEAAMVAQFKDNEFEKQFYGYDKTMAGSDYKKIYYIPALESQLAFVNSHYTSTDEEVKQQLADNLELLRNEIKSELDMVGHENFPEVDRFYPGQYDSSLYPVATRFLSTLNKYYIARYNNANQKKDAIIRERTATEEGEKEFEKLKGRYQNEAIAELVKNTIEQHRIVRSGNELVQKIFPIYKDPDPKNMVDFDAQFYMARKHFFGQNIDTFYFNLGVVWFMTIILVITLYYEVLRKIIDGLGNISNPIPKRM